MRFVNVLFEFYSPECPVRRGSDGHDSELPPEKRQVGREILLQTEDDKVPRNLGPQRWEEGG